MEGEKLKQLADSLTRDTNRIFEKGVVGRNVKIIQSNNRVLRSYNQNILAVDAATKARKREVKTLEDLEAAAESYIEIEEKLGRARTAKSRETLTKALVAQGKTVLALERALESATYARAKAEMTAAASGRELDTSRLAGIEAKKKQRKADVEAAKELKKLTSVQDEAKVALQSYTAELDVSSGALKQQKKAHKDTIASNKAIRKTFETATDSVKGYKEQHDKLIEMMDDPKANSSALRAQVNRTNKAFLAMGRSVRNATESVGEIEKLTTVQQRATVALTDYTKMAQLNEAVFRREMDTNRNAIESNKGLRRAFDTAKESVIRYQQQHDKLIEMMDSGTASSSALQAQINSTGGAYRGMERNIREATAALQTHMVEEAKSATRSPFGRGGRKAPDIEGSLARNLGALTPLGTVSPGLLIPLGAAFVALAQGVIAASQSLLILPGALTAAGAGFGVVQMATMGVSDALTAMMDINNPEKFAESLRLLSPAAQQFALSIQQLIPTFMEMKNVVQDTFFAGLPQLINGLAQTYRDSFGNMAVGVSQAFNDIFMTIGNVLQDPRGQQAVGAMFDGIVQSFQALVPLIPPLTQLFIQIAGLGAQVLPSVIDDITAMTARFAEFINTASASGDLKNWMMEGWAALKAVGEVVVYTGKMLYEVFGLHGPEDIERFKTTLFGIVDGFGIFFGTLEKFFTGLVNVFNAFTDSGVGQFISYVIDKFGGLETVLAGLAGGLLVGKIIFSFRKFFKFIDDGLAWAVLRIATIKAGMAGLPAAAGAAGTAAGTAAAAGVAAGGAKAGSGFASKLSTVLRGAGWIGLGTIIAELIGQGLRDGQDGWRDSLAKGLDPAFWFNPVEWVNTIREAFGKEPLAMGPGGMMYPKSWVDKDKPASPNPSDPSNSPWGGEPDPVYGNDGKPYLPVPTGTPGAVPIPGKGAWGTPTTPPPTGGRPSAESDSTWGEIPDFPMGGIPVPTPNPGGGPTPNIPSNQYSLQNIPLGQFGPAQWSAPDPKSLMSQLTPNQLSQKGYGYQVDPQGIFDAETAVMQQRAAVEEARARVLELAQDNQATEQEKLKAQNNIIEQERGYLKSQVQLLEAQRGTWKKINESTSDQTDMLKGLGAEIDADFGISKGLPGIAENIVKFLANITAAPVYGALAGMRAAGGDTGGGKGLVGAAALSGAFGPQYMQPDSSTPAPGTITYGPSTPGAPSALTPGPPLAAEAGYTLGLNPKNVSTAGLKPQSMALLSLIQGMPQFKNVPLTSGYRPPGNPADALPGGGMIPWHPNGRGLDFGLNAANPAESALGDQLNKFLNDNKAMFGINHTLWKTMQGGNHYNHLHVGLNDGESPLQQNQALKGITPPAAGGTPGTMPSTASLGGGSIPIPLPVTIVGGMPAGLPAAGSPAITPPSGTPGAPLKPGSTPGAPGASPADGQPIPAAGPPGSTPGSTGSMKDGGETKVWTVNPDGTVSWRSFYGNPTGAPKGQPGSSATTPGPRYTAPGSTPPALPSPGQGGPIPWTLPPLTPAGGDTPMPAPAAGGLPLAPGGYTPPGTGPSQIGAVVGPPVGTGGGFAGISGGILGAAQGAIGAAAGAAGAMGGGGMGGGAAAGALAQIGIEELNRAIAFAGQAAGIGVSGLMETFLPTGGSELANNGWLPKILGGVVGARPLLPNFANISGASSDVQAQQNAGNTPQAGAAGNVNVTQNNYAQNGNSATNDLERLAVKATAAPMPAMGAGR